MSAAGQPERSLPEALRRNHLLSCMRNRTSRQVYIKLVASLFTRDRREKANYSAPAVRLFILQTCRPCKTMVCLRTRRAADSRGCIMRGATRSHGAVEGGVRARRERYRHQRRASWCHRPTGSLCLTVEWIRNLTSRVTCA
jgi:hypothetical protein